MATITQTIPNLFQGISEQPDEQKLPGQVRNAENVVPDIIEGLTKRPGLEFVKTLSNVQSDGSWFEYYRDEDEGSYVGQVATNGTVRVWRLSGDNAGLEMNVTGSDNPSSYLAHPNDSDIQALTINDTTYLVNKTKVVGMNTSILAPSKPDTHSVYVELKQVQPRRQYALNIFNNSVNDANYWDDYNSATTVEIAAKPGGDLNTENVGDHNDARLTGSKVHVDTTTKIAVRVTVSGQPFVSGYQSNPATNANYETQYTLRVDLLHGGFYVDAGTLPSFEVTIGIQPYTITVTKQVTGSYRGNLARIRPVPVDIEAETSLSISGVLNSIYDEFDGTTFLSSGGSRHIIGNGLLIRSTNADFDVEALESDLFQVTKDTVNDVTKLPTQCRHGYIVKVTNTAQLTEDDYYLKFVGDNELDGPGHWEECVEPGLKTHIDNTTMPYKLVRTGLTTMALSAETWKQREVGDDTSTNKKPSFVGDKISKVLFHRDRLVMLSGSNIILSQPGDLTNFWNKTALTWSGIDRIDISCSSSSPNSLVDGIETNGGLVLFSANAQYLFATDSDTLNPETAKVTTLSTYNYNPNVSPISLGTSLAFIDNAGKYSRYFEMFNVGRESQPEIIENSKLVQRLLPKDLNSIANSRENSFILMCKRDTNSVVGFKYFGGTDKRLQGSWFTWNFAKNISHQFIINDEYYIVTSENELCKIQLMDVAARPVITQAGDDFDVHLDYHKKLESSHLSYNASTDVTTLTLPSDTPLNNGDTVSVIVHGSSNNKGRYATGTVSSGSISLTHDWSSDEVYVGKEYEMKVELPTIYPTSTKSNKVVADTSASLIVQRIKLNFGPVGQFITKLVRTGKPDFIDTHESSIMDGYLANTAPNTNGSFRTIPVYERNTNLSVTISSTHPSPANIESMSWEGEYTNRFYKRI